MDKREKVIKGMKVCILDFISRRTCELTKCPYACIKDQGIQHYECRKTLLKDALELLKAQEPRVMTLDEVKALPVESDVWVEITGAKGSKPRITATTIHGNGEKEIFGWLHTFNFAAYGKETYGWRCWTSRPTEEQRKAVKFDG